MIQANPATVFTAGDNQYPRGQIEDFTNPDGYAGSWGRAALKSKTCPTVGNHEYSDPLPGPAGYLAYFSPPCPHRPDIEYAKTSGGFIIPTVYAYRPAPGSGWWAYVLDSQCNHSEERGPNCAQRLQPAQLVPSPHGRPSGEMPHRVLASPPVRERCPLWRR